MKWGLRIALLISAVAIAYCVGMFLLALWSRRPIELGIRAGRLAPCRNSSNCVSSQTELVAQYMPPIQTKVPRDEARSRLRRILEEMPRTTIVEQAADYIHAEVRSAFWGFVDDVELYIDPVLGEIHFRSASRVGFRDLGVNRLRMDSVREAWELIEQADKTK